MVWKCEEMCTRLLRKCKRLVILGIGRGRSKKCWRQVIRHDMTHLQVVEDMTLDKRVWRIGTRVDGSGVFSCFSRVYVCLVLAVLLYFLLLTSIVICFYQSFNYRIILLFLQDFHHFPGNYYVLLYCFINSCTRICCT